MIVPHKRTIDGIDFEVSPLPAFRALELFPRITGFFAGAVSELGAVQRDKGEAIAKAIAALAKSNPAELVALTKVLLEGCIITLDGKQALLLPVFDVAMQGKLFTVMKLLGFAIEVNYRDFFSGLDGLVGGLKKALSSAFPMTSAGHGPAGG